MNLGIDRQLSGHSWAVPVAVREQIRQDNLATKKERKLNVKIIATIDN